MPGRVPLYTHILSVSFIVLPRAHNFFKTRETSQVQSGKRGKGGEGGGGGEGNGGGGEGGGGEDGGSEDYWFTREDFPWQCETVGCDGGEAELREAEGGEGAEGEGG